MPKQPNIKTDDIQKKLAVKLKDHLGDYARGSFMTTPQSVKCVLQEHLGRIEKKGAWKAPISVAFTIFLTLATTDFKDIFGITGDQWKTAAVVIFILCLVLFFKALPAAFSKNTIDDVVRGIEKEGTTNDTGDK